MSRVRGWSSLAAMMALAALASLMSVGLSSRTNDLSFESRALCRTKARWAAESGIARARNQGGPLSGTLEPGVTYRVQQTGTLRTSVGECRLGQQNVQIQIEARVLGPRLIGWQETAPAKP